MSASFLNDDTGIRQRANAVLSRLYVLNYVYRRAASLKAQFCFLVCLTLSTFAFGPCARAQDGYLICEEYYTGDLLDGFLNYGQPLDADITITTNAWVPDPSNPNQPNPIAGSHSVLVYDPDTNNFKNPPFYFNVNQDGTIEGIAPKETKTDAKGVKSYTTVIGTYQFIGDNFPFSADSESATFPPVTDHRQFWLDPPFSGPPPAERLRQLTITSDFSYVDWARWVWWLEWAEGPYVPGVTPFDAVHVPVKFTLQAMPVPNCPTCQSGKGCPTCSGGGGGSPHLATASLSRFDAGIVITDTPISYDPAIGTPMTFTVNYEQRYSGPTAFTYSNLGPQWNMGWISYITGGPTNQEGEAVYNNASNGAQYAYDGYEQTVVSGNAPSVVAQGDFQDNQAFSHGTLHYRQSPERYEQWLPDGTVQVFAQPINTSTGRQFFLTLVTDPQGNVTTLSYSPAAAAKGLAVLTSVTDPKGGQLLFSYDNSDPLKITRVTRGCDGLSAKFGYTSGQLTSITDPGGLTSSYHYTSGTNFIDSMTTPYGTTTFSSTDGHGFYEAAMINPLGQTERVEYQSNLATSLYPASEASAPSATGLTLNNANLNQNNTFYWTRRAMADAAAGGIAIDSAGFYTMAQVAHWATSPEGTIPVALSTKMPLEGRVWYNYPGQNGDFIDPTAAGTSTSASAIARLLDDGTTQVSYTSYNANGMITQKVDPVGRTENYYYDTNGIDLLSITQTNGSGQDTLTTITYNSQHQPLTITDASGQTTALAYNNQGQILTSTNPKSEATTITYDGNGYIHTKTEPATGATTTYGYDASGRIHTVTDSQGYSVIIGYDNLDRLVSTTFPDGTSDRTIYKRLDAWQSIDRQGRITWNTYDAIHELLQTIDPQGRTTEYQWCTCGGLSTLTDPNGNLTTWNLDMQGRVTGKLYSDGSHLTYTYETNTGRRQSSTDARGDIAVYHYNPDNTLSSVSYTSASGVAATPTVSFVYDPFYNRVTSMTDGTGTTAYTYNPVTGSTTTGAGKLASANVPITGTGQTGTAAYNYDELGRVITRTIDGGATITAVYDALGRITNVTNPLGEFAYSYVDATSRLSTVTYPSSTGLNTSYEYYGNTSSDGNPSDDDQRLKDLTYSKSGAVLSQFQYTYNPVGTIATLVEQTDSDPPKTYTFGFDHADQLTSSTETDSSTPPDTISSSTYHYDPSGNRIAELSLSGTTVDRFNSLNQLTGVSPSSGTQTIAGHTTGATTNVTINAIPATINNGTNFTANIPEVPGTNTVSISARPPGGAPTTQRYQFVTNGTPPVQLTYDADGNTLSDENGCHYQWDALSRLVSISYPSGASSLLTYDGLGRRTQIVEKDSGGATTSTKNYLWIGGQIAEERDENNMVTSCFYPQGEEHTTAKYYYTRDHLGSIREVVDTSGAMVARYAYDEYGRPPSGASSNLVMGTNISTFQYAGDFYHGASGLYLTWYRAYDANTGRWLSRDPASESEGVNLYAYVTNSPIDLVDPEGQAAQLSYTDQSITAGQCGQFSWVINWILNGPLDGGGFIIQRIHIHVHVENCNGETLTDEDSQYREAWSISSTGKVFGSGTDTWSYDGAGDCTKGNATFTSGGAVYHGGMTSLPSDFSPGKAPPSGILPSSTKTYFPWDSLGGNESNAIKRSLKLTWDCCGKDKSTHYSK